MSTCPYYHLPYPSLARLVRRGRRWMSRLGGPPQAEAAPHVLQGGNELRHVGLAVQRAGRDPQPLGAARHGRIIDRLDVDTVVIQQKVTGLRSEEHTSELQSLMRISYAVFCLNKKQK